MSVFSNHSHGFALFTLIVLLITGVILCLQLAQRSPGLAVSDRVPERECGLLPIHPAALIAPQREPTVAGRWLLSFLKDHVLLSLQPSQASQEKALGSKGCGF